jgi:hypothetical protein
MARYFLSNPEDALQAALTAALRLEPELENQYKRSVQPAQKRTITNLEPEHLFLALTIDAIDEVASEQEEQNLLPSTLAAQSRYALHLIRMGRKHSFNLAVATLRILYDYPQEAVRCVYEEGLCGPVRDQYHRTLKQEYMAAARRRFPDRLRTITMMDREQRFATAPLTEQEWESLRHTLRLCTVFGGHYPIPEDFSLAPTMVDPLIDKPDDPEGAHRNDRSRLDALVDPFFLARVTQACGRATPREAISVAIIHRPVPPSPAPSVIEVSLEEVDPTERELVILETALAGHRRHRNEWTGGEITLIVNNDQALPLWFGESRTAVVPADRGVHVIDAWGLLGGMPILLGSLSLNLIGDDERQFTMSVPHGEFTISILPGTEPGTITLHLTAQSTSTDTACSGLIRYRLELGFSLTRVSILDSQVRARPPAQPV